MNMDSDFQVGARQPALKFKAGQPTSGGEVVKRVIAGAGTAGWTVLAPQRHLSSIGSGLPGPPACLWAGPRATCSANAHTEV